MHWNLLEIKEKRIRANRNPKVSIKEKKSKVDPQSILEQTDKKDRGCKVTRYLK